ncbi:hypothetical protein [Agromyces ramosus]|uniref:Type IV secretory pathway VirB10-like protein n=1 Tax=Agromyces ramosus TaxID=33879 RepID=A0ABU0R8N4_9MICO|nr:hypothetical protein [Agromyces ramosus]MDQ0894433.1 type IV secretory pathway VirB10-like protein [Agromyces ramosus]
MHKHSITAFPTLRDRDGMAVIGRTANDLRGIRYNTDPGGNTPPPADPPAPPAPPAPAPPAPAPAPAPPAPPAPAPPVHHRGDPDEHVRELREEAKERRLKLEQEQAAHTTTQQERDAAAAERDQYKRENALLLAAPKFGARADLLLDSSNFMKSFADVDLSKEDDVKKAIEDAIERNAAFKSGPGLPPTSGGGHQGGGTPATPMTLDGAVKKALGG